LLEATAVGVVTALALAGCGGRGADKAGGQRPAKPIVLSVANYTFGPVEVGAFAQEVARRSHGTIRLVFRNNWRLGQRDVETVLIHDVVAGRADLGWVGSREWDAFGDTSFDALHLPFLVDSYDLEQAVLQSPLAREMLESLKPVGVVGIGILPGELRRVVGVERPLLRAADFRGLTFGTTQARAALATIRALGARPVPFLVLPSIRRFGGFDFPITSFEGNAYDLQARYITANVALWPRPLVLFMNEHSYGRLTPGQQSVLRDAAAAAIPGAAAYTRASERKAVTALCTRARTRFVHASAADLAQLRRAVASVLAAADRRTRGYAARIQAIKRRLAAPPQAPPTCPPLARGAGALPDGTYESTMTAADVRRAKVPAGDVLYDDLPIRHRLVVRGRTFVLYATSRNGRTQADMEGTYSTYRGKIRFSTTGETLLPISWSLHGSTLRFFDLPFNGTGYYGALFSPVWTKTR
jgi:TRAP-type C4-dicarboxylate transport system substrate-binding protein